MWQSTAGSTIQRRKSDTEEEHERGKLVFDPKEVCNQMPHSHHYYKYRCQGLVYQKQQQQEQLALQTHDKKEQAEKGKPIRKLYINIEKDGAPKMFGYRVRFDENQMKSYSGEGKPAIRANQGHKPIYSWT